MVNSTLVDMNNTSLLSWELKRLLMAEIKNEEDGGHSPTTLESARESLEDGYEPYVGFEPEPVGKELNTLIDTLGGNTHAEELLSDEDWKRHATCRADEIGERRWRVVLELSTSEGHPGKWDWTDLLNTDGKVNLVSVDEIDRMSVNDPLFPNKKED